MRTPMTTNKPTRGDVAIAGASAGATGCVGCFGCVVLAWKPILILLIFGAILKYLLAS